MDDLPARSGCAQDLARSAASAEPDSRGWQKRFSALLSGGLVRFPVQPGSELAQQFPLAQGASSVATEIAGLVHKLLPVIRKRSQVCIDVSAVSCHAAITIAEIAAAFAVALKGDSLVQRYLSFSVNAEHAELHDTMKKSHLKMMASVAELYKKVV